MLTIFSSARLSPAASRACAVSLRLVSVSSSRRETISGLRASALILAAVNFSMIWGLRAVVGVAADSGFGAEVGDGELAVGAGWLAGE